MSTEAAVLLLFLLTAGLGGCIIVLARAVGLLAEIVEDQLLGRLDEDED